MSTPKLDRERIFGKSKSKHFWCRHCERTYKQDEFRQVGELQMCPYQDCNGDTVIDAWPWEDVRKGNPDYPRVPERGKVYPFHRTQEINQDEFDRYQQVCKAEGGLIGQAQAALVVGLSKQRLNALVESRQLRQHKFFNKEYITCKELADFRNRKRRSGRPCKQSARSMV